jgi:hypothetical protein
VFDLNISVSFSFSRLFFRWHSSVLLSIRPQDATTTNTPQRESADASTDPEHLKSRPTGNFTGYISSFRLLNFLSLALKVTPASIKAFIRYFATEIIRPKYEIPDECIQASIALTESLFYR